MDESSALLSPAEEPKPLDTAVLHLSPSTRLRLDTAAILLSDAARSEWSDRPSMVDSPDLYYAFVSWNIFRRMALIATYIVLVTTALVKPAWCQQSDLCKLDSYPTMLDEEYMYVDDAKNTNRNLTSPRLFDALHFCIGCTCRRALELNWLALL
jgi:hypothetical protein